MPRLSPKYARSVIAVLGFTATLASPSAAHASIAACATSTAKRVFHRQQLNRHTDYDQAGVPQHGQTVLRLACGDVTGDGREDMVMTLGYPGAINVQWAVFRRTTHGYKPVRFEDSDNSPRHYYTRSEYVAKGYVQNMVAKGLRLRVRRATIQEGIRLTRPHEHTRDPTGPYVTHGWRWNGRYLVGRSSHPDHFS